jgi:hypothetical protein
MLSHLLLAENEKQETEIKKRLGKNKYIQNIKKIPTIAIKENQKFRESMRSEICSNINKVLKQGQGIITFQN